MKRVLHLIVKFLFLYIVVCFFSSCVFEMSHEISTKNLHDSVNANLQLFDGSNLIKLSDVLCDNEIIFLGEVHGIAPLIETAAQLSVHLAKHRPVVYASELTYGLSFFVEPVSLGNPTPSTNYNIPKCIKEFNYNQNAENKILVTAIDVEHSVYTNKRATSVYLLELVSRSSSSNAKELIGKEVAQLSNQDSFANMDRFLKRLKKVIVRHIDTFAPEDQEEVMFFMELLVASNRFYRYTNESGISKFWLIPRGWDIREEYFIKTVERAYWKAQKRAAILLCRVGIGHITADKKNLGRHFRQAYRPTKGKVACVNMMPIYYDNSEPNCPDKSIDSVVKHLMKDYEYGYLSLNDLQKNTDYSLSWSRHFYGKRPKYDGILFVRIVQK